MPASMHSAERRKISLRTRLTVWVVAIFLLIQVLIGLLFWTYQRSTIVDVFRDRLAERTESMTKTIAAQLPDLTEEELTTIASNELGYIQFESFDIDVIDADGNSALGGAPKWPEAVDRLVRPALSSGRAVFGELDPDNVSFAMRDSKRVMVIAMPISDAGTAYATVVATSDAFIRRQMNLITQALIGGGILGMIASGMSGWFISGIAVAPIRRLSSVFGQFDPDRMEEAFDGDADNAEVQELTAQLDASRNRIRDAFAAQERFLSNISHEIKTPIATLLVEAHTIDKSKLSQEGRAFVDTVEDEMRKLGKLVESFLMLTRVRSGDGRVDLSGYPANELLMDSVANCSALAKLHEVRLKPELAEDSIGIEAEVTGNPDLLRTMLDNLIRNAIRFTPSQGVIRVQAGVEGVMFTFRIQDEGPGIPTDMLDSIFERHRQAPEEVSRERGQGLGLAIAQGIAELHGGTIRAENLEPTGAAFTVSMPIAVTELATRSNGDPPKP